MDWTNDRPLTLSEANAAVIEKMALWWSLTEDLAIARLKRELGQGKAPFGITDSGLGW